MSHALIESWQDWECPNCSLTDRTRPLPPNSSHMHDCAGLHGLTAPMVLLGTDCKVVAVERGDYLRGETQRTGENGTPYMAVETIHADGHNDLHVFPGVAIAGAAGGNR